MWGVCRIGEKMTKTYYIVPRKEFVKEIVATDKEDAIAKYAAQEDSSDYNQFLQVVTKEELENIRRKADSEAHDRFVTAFMKQTLVDDFDVPEKDAQDVAKNAYDIYCRGDGQTEYECIEEAYEEYQND